MTLVNFKSGKSTRIKESFNTVRKYFNQRDRQLVNKVIHSVNNKPTQWTKQVIDFNEVESIEVD